MQKISEKIQIEKQSSLSKEQRKSRTEISKRYYERIKQDPERHAKYKERIREGCKKRYHRIKQDPEKYAKQQHYVQQKSKRHYQRIRQDSEIMKRRRAAAKNYHQNLTEEQKEKRRLYYRIRGKIYYNRHFYDPEKYNKRLQRLRENFRRRMRSIEYQKKRAQYYKERYAQEKQRMQNDPHYAYYQNEYLKAIKNERKGKPITADQPR